MRPMLLARENPDTSKLTYPLYVYPKLDGIRCLITGEGAMSRTLKKIPNKLIQSVLSSLGISGFDGELIWGSPTSSTVYRDTNSVVMSHDKQEPFTYYVFDLWDHGDSGFVVRQLSLTTKVIGLPNYIKQLTGRCVNSEAELLEYEQQCLNEGYEGVILRNPSSHYKYGRTTMKENNTFKLKRFVDDEAVIVSFEEEMHNGNTAETNELGRTKRSTAKEGLLPKGTLGAFICETSEKVTFKIGSGFDQSDRETFWTNREKLLGRMVKYKHFPIGVKDKPRHPIFLGFRDMEIDG